MTDSEKKIVISIYDELVKYAFSSLQCSIVYRMYPDAFFKEKK